ncbi:helix-turn-helix domain-containing protein [Stutzerimonas frequens]|uniref:helix-turn-helix domain-containing protein n=1 Tax=Stutzerimonas frequens TaxID=2968969 RepID=UPI003748728A
MHIGQVIYALRQERHLTQEHLALEVETATSNLSRIERGKSKPSIALLERLAKALGTSITAIYAQVEGVPLATNEKTDSDDFSRAAVHLRQGFRELTVENQHLTLEFVRMLQRLQQ